MNPPLAARHPHPHRIHHDVRPDDYYWLREKENPEVIHYLEAENHYFDEMMKPLRPFQEKLYREMLEHIPESEEDVPAQSDPYFYYSRINQDQQYRTYYRKRAKNREDLIGAAEEVILDVNALAEGQSFLSVTTVLLSPNHERLAYLENRDGTDRYTLFIKDLTQGTLVDAPIPNVYIGGSLAWDKKSQYLFYLTVDESQRPNQLWRHQLLSAEADVLLFEESDITFTLNLHTSQSGEYLFLITDTKTSSEVHYLSLSTPEALFRMFAARRSNILYTLEHWHESFLILTNENAENFTLFTVPTENPQIALAQPLVPYDANRYLQDVIPFKEALLIYGREEGLSQLWTYQDGTLHRLTWDEPLYTVSLGHNISYDAREMLVSFSSLITPKIDYAIHMPSGERTMLRQEPIGHYDKSQYLQEKLWAPAQDGTLIPLSVVAQKSSSTTPRPLILYGYGSYGSNSNPTFDPTRLPLLDRGVIYVLAHVRGGSEMGRSWYEDGKLIKKRNSFTDFVDSARYLIQQGYTTPELLAARGRSAGGLLMGAVLNLAPELFQVVVPGVPFVDVLTTMLDASIPLTSLEWDEWGNPAEPKDYQYMKTYSPYDNVEEKPYPHMLVYTGLNDPRVGYFEPAKWVARLRVMKTDRHQLLLKTNMGAGHGGSSGRFARLNEFAEEYAFILDKLGISH